MTARAAPALTDPLPLLRALLRCPSVTPRDEGALALVAEALGVLGFAVRRLEFGEGAARIGNLYAVRGEGAPHLCFAGHTDVVPAGDASGWSMPPFAAALRGDVLYGRGASDMKGAIAAFIAALARRPPAAPGRVSLLITGDEEGPAEHGTKAVVELLRREGERIDDCLVGEPTCGAVLGDTIKIGRRGSLNARLTLRGVQGHVAYPDRARNPIPGLLAILGELTAAPLDRGTEDFDTSNLEITSIDVANETTNLIPAAARARLNIRYNTLHTASSLARRVEACAGAAARARGLEVEVETLPAVDAFLSADLTLAAILKRAIRELTGIEAAYSTSGGTSDARFLKELCPTAELGLVGATMHKADEHVPLADLEGLTAIYARTLAIYFAERVPR